MQENARKICIYQIKAVHLHRQNNLSQADNRQNGGFYYVRCRKSIGISTPCEGCNGLANPAIKGFDNG